VHQVQPPVDVAATLPTLPPGRSAVSAWHVVFGTWVVGSLPLAVLVGRRLRGLAPPDTGVLSELPPAPDGQVGTDGRLPVGASVGGPS
jgi:hypothetical protein